MAKSTIVAVALAIALIASNAWWALQLLDAGVSQTYMSVSLDDNRMALSQAIAVAEESSREGATRETIIAAAEAEAGETVDPFEKDGYLWVGRVGLKFQPDGRLMRIARSWSPP